MCPWFVYPLWSRIILLFGRQVLLTKAKNPNHQDGDGGSEVSCS